jgi:hypothetical protein
MLSLTDAATYFDRTQVLDPDTGTVLFLGQVDPYDDSKRDAGGAYRRILSLAPGTAVPASRAVRIFGQVWLIGNKEVDGLELAHRDKYVLQPAGQQLSIGRLSGYLGAVAAGTAWAGVEWIKDGKEMGASSEVVRMHNIFLATGFDVRARDVVWNSNGAYLVLSIHEQPSGYKLASTAQLDYPVATATLVPRVYSPTLGAYTPGAPASVAALRVRWQNLFAYADEAAARYQEGDDTIVLPAGTAVDTASRITLDSEEWTVLAVNALGGAVTVHGRPAWAT